MRLVIVASIVVAALGAVACSSSSDKPKAAATAEGTKASSARTAPVATEQVPPTTAPKSLSYDIIDRWNIPNGGEGKAIVISPAYLNEKDMTALGEKLKKDTKGDRNAFIFVYTDPKAVALRSKIADLNQTDGDFYDQHFVATYTRNINTGFHKFEIWYDGVSGTNTKTIDY